MENSIFTKIINGIIPCYKISENDNFIAFLDVNPLQEGHTLVVPKKQIDYIYDLPDDILSELFIFSIPLCEACLYIVKKKSRAFPLFTPSHRPKLDPREIAPSRRLSGPSCMSVPEASPAHRSPLG